MATLVANHEAGHVLAALELGLEVRSASIVRTSRSHGHVAVAGLADNDYWRDAAFSFAGSVAEEIAGGYPDSFLSERDIEKGTRAACRAGLRIAEVRSAVRRLVDVPLLARIADALDCRKTLDGEEILALTRGEPVHGIAN
jgi:hypothetical protein